VVAQVFADLGLSLLFLSSLSPFPSLPSFREVFHQTGKDPFTLPERDPVMFFLQRLRDESHRFAIGSHRTKRKIAMHKSPLDGIPGVGGRRKKALLHHFGSGRAVEQAGVEDLATVDSISKNLAQSIYDHFHDDS